MKMVIMLSVEVDGGGFEALAEMRSDLEAE
jgi:hypothetical protein